MVILCFVLFYLSLLIMVVFVLLTSLIDRVGVILLMMFIFVILFVTVFLASFICMVFLLVIKGTYSLFVVLVCLA